MTTFTVSLSDPTNRFAAQAADIRANVQYAADMLARWVPGLGDIAISVVIDAAVSTANGASAAAREVASSGGVRTMAQGMAYEIATGTDPNGSGADVRIGVGADFLASTYWVDPTPATSSDIPRTGYDFISGMLHELLHALAFNGYRDWASGALPGSVQSTFDAWVQVSAGRPFFAGPTAVAVFGAPVPLTPGNLYHYGASAETRSGLLASVLNGFGRDFGRRYDLNELDLAILQDSGVAVQRPTRGTESADELSSPLQGIFSGLGGNDTIRGSAKADTIDGGAGIDTVVYAGARSAYTLAGTAATRVVESASDGRDTLSNVERLRFGDGALALDLDGNAGLAAKLLGAVFGAAAVHDRAYAGIALSLLDGGMPRDQLANLALNVRAGAGATSSDVVALLYANVMGSTPSAATLSSFASALDNGTFSRASLAWLAAELPANAALIGLAGLSQTGLDYI